MNHDGVNESLPGSIRTVPPGFSDLQQFQVGQFPSSDTQPEKKTATEKNAIGEENKIHLATAAAVLSHGRLWDAQTLIAWRYVFLEGKYVSKAWWELLQFWSSTYQILNSIAFFYMLYT